jgi:hypothetical protein
LNSFNLATHKFFVKRWVTRLDRYDRRISRSGEQVSSRPQAKMAEHVKHLSK